MAKTAILSCFAVLLIVVSSAISMDKAAFRNSLNSFSQNLFSEIAKTNGGKNIIYSPFSVQTSLAMVRMGADGETAIEMDRGLGFTGQTTESVAQSFHAMMADFESSSLVTLANKMYLMQGHDLKQSYQDVLNKNFHSSVELINFADNANAANTINNWVEGKTNNLVKDLVTSDDFGVLTRFALVNAIHFKGDWLKPFDIRETELKDFYMDDTKSIKVPTMYTANFLAYAELNELDAKAVRLPYNNSDLSMLLILPNSRNGLAAMQQKLMAMDLEGVTKKLHTSKVAVQLPKFKAEFAIELTDALKNLGMRRMFVGANFGKMLKSPGDLVISKVIHKACIEVNEKGTEAAAATSSIGRYRSRQESFDADHPFYYAIISSDNVVLFQGNVVSFDK